MTNENDYYISEESLRLADKAEIHALRNGTATASDGFTELKLTGADDYFRTETEDHVSWEEEDLIQESSASGVVDSIGVRQRLLKSAYPFGQEIEGNLEYVPSSNLVYEFCLAACNSPNLTTGQYSCIPRVFERLVTVLMKTYIGFGGDAIHIGWPRDRGTSFREVMREVNKRTNEWIWGPDDDVNDELADRYVKDEGLDVLAWQKVDERKGSLFYFGHCTCAENVKGKVHDANVGEICKWFNPAMYVKEPVRLFFTPFHLKESDITRLSRTAGVVIDRIKLTILAGDSDHLLSNTDLVQCISELIGLVRGNTR